MLHGEPGQDPHANTYTHIQCLLTVTYAHTQHACTNMCTHTYTCHLEEKSQFTTSRIKQSTNVWHAWAKWILNIFHTSSKPWMSKMTISPEKILRNFIPTITEACVIPEVPTRIRHPKLLLDWLLTKQLVGLPCAMVCNHSQTLLLNSVYYNWMTYYLWEKALLLSARPHMRCRGN